MHRFLDIGQTFASAKKAQTAWLSLCFAEEEGAEGLANELLRALRCTEPDASSIIALALQPRFRKALFEGGLMRTEMQWGSLRAFREFFSRTPQLKQREIMLSLIVAAEKDAEHEEELIALALELLKRVRIADPTLKLHRTVLLRLHESGASARALRFHLRNFLQMF